LREHSWITGLSAFTDMKEPDELQTSRAIRNEPLSEGDAIKVSGEHRAEKRTNSRISATLFISVILPLIHDTVNIKLRLSKLRLQISIVKKSDGNDLTFTFFLSLNLRLFMAVKCRPGIKPGSFCDRLHGSIPLDGLA